VRPNHSQVLGPDTNQGSDTSIPIECSLFSIEAAPGLPVGDKFLKITLPTCTQAPTKPWRRSSEATSVSTDLIHAPISAYPGRSLVRCWTAPMSSLRQAVAPGEEIQDIFGTPLAGRKTQIQQESEQANREPDCPPTHLFMQRVGSSKN
jgi:hypothetical protein